MEELEPGPRSSPRSPLCWPCRRTWGSTWDALSDVLRDRLDAGPLTLLIIDAGELLVDEPAGQYALLLAVFGDLATSAPHPLRVVLHGASPADR